MQTWKAPELLLNLGSLRSLTVASIKMYFRNRSAVFFTLFLPLVFMTVFGLLGQSGARSFSVDVTNGSNSALSKQVLVALKKVSALKIVETSEATAADQLNKGKIDLQVIIPADFGQVDLITKRVQPSEILTHYNSAKPGNGQAANLVLREIVARFNAQLTGVPPVMTVKSTGVQANNLTVLDFLLPGILAMSIMQLGIFSVAFAFVSMKVAGMLRRIQATPTHPANFVVAQAITRLIVGLLQVLLLIGLGIWFFNFNLIGNMAEFLVVVVLGTLVFLAFGFTVAGYAKDENQAAPIANLISFPMLFLSGVFFARDGFPAWLQSVTNYLPLTYLVDALRRIANEGAHLAQLGGDLLGLTVWGVVMFVVAIRVFNWE